MALTLLTLRASPLSTPLRASASVLLSPHHSSLGSGLQEQLCEVPWSRSFNVRQVLPKSSSVSESNFRGLGKASVSLFIKWAPNLPVGMMVTKIIQCRTTTIGSW